MNRCIDLNCDLGEGAGQDELLMPLITSANIACGAHAGDEQTMRETVMLARQHNVMIGAHPGYEDRGNFGRTEIELPKTEVYTLVAQQIRALAQIADACGSKLVHVKPHGALYNVAARDSETARGIAEAVRDSGGGLKLFALAGSVLATVGTDLGLDVAQEVFADRAYSSDGSLVPRSRTGAVHSAEMVMIDQVITMISRGVVKSIDGVEVPVRADTLCLHGDGAHAVPFARLIRRSLAQAGVEAAPFASYGCGPFR